MGRKAVYCHGVMDPEVQRELACYVASVDMKKPALVTLAGEHNVDIADCKTKQQIADTINKTVLERNGFTHYKEN